MYTIVAASLLAGCTAAPEPTSAPPPPAREAPPSQPPNVVAGAPDTARAVPGSANSLYMFRFKQTDPASDGFTYRDREVSFYFRPSPTTLYFRVENLLGRPDWIDWDKSQFIDINGQTYKVAHSTTRYKDRYSPQALTQVAGQQQYGDYVLPMDYLLDPGGAPGDDQPHRPIVPEDQSAPTYSGRSFGVDLAMTVDDRPRVYSFRFQVASVIPR